MATWDLLFGNINDDDAATEHHGHNSRNNIDEDDDAGIIEDLCVNDENVEVGVDSESDSEEGDQLPPIAEPEPVRIPYKEKQRLIFGEKKKVCAEQIKELMSGSCEETEAEDPVDFYFIQSEIVDIFSSRVNGGELISETSTIIQEQVDEWINEVNELTGGEFITKLAQVLARLEKNVNKIDQLYEEVRNYPSFSSIIPSFNYFTKEYFGTMVKDDRRFELLRTLCWRMCDGSFKEKNSLFKIGFYIPYIHDHMYASLQKDIFDQIEKIKKEHTKYDIIKEIANLIKTYDELIVSSFNNDLLMRKGVYEQFRTTMMAAGWEMIKDIAKYINKVVKSNELTDFEADSIIENVLTLLPYCGLSDDSDVKNLFYDFARNYLSKRLISRCGLETRLVRENVILAKLDQYRSKNGLLCGLKPMFNMRNDYKDYYCRNKLTVNILASINWIYLEHDHIPTAILPPEQNEQYLRFVSGYEKEYVNSLKRRVKLHPGLGYAEIKMTLNNGKSMMLKVNTLQMVVLSLFNSTNLLPFGVILQKSGMQLRVLLYTLETLQLILAKILDHKGDSCYVLRDEFLDEKDCNLMPSQKVMLEKCFQCISPNGVKSEEQIEFIRLSVIHLLKINHMISDADLKSKLIQMIDGRFPLNLGILSGVLVTLRKEQSLTVQEENNKDVYVFSKI